MKWKSSSSPHSSPCDFRCPTFQEFSPASFASGFFGSTPQEQDRNYQLLQTRGSSPDHWAPIIPTYYQRNLFQPLLLVSSTGAVVCGKGKENALRIRGLKKALVRRLDGTWEMNSLFFFFFQDFVFYFWRWGEIFRMCLKIKLFPTPAHQGSFYIQG